MTTAPETNTAHHDVRRPQATLLGLDVDAHHGVSQLGRYAGRLEDLVLRLAELVPDTILANRLELEELELLGDARYHRQVLVDAEDERRAAALAAAPSPITGPEVTESAPLDA